MIFTYFHAITFYRFRLIRYEDETKVAERKLYCCPMVYKRANSNSSG